MNTRTLANALVSKAINEGGATLDLEGNPSGRGAFLIGGAVANLVLPQSGDLTTLTNTVELWLRVHQDELAGHLVGSWQEGTGANTANLHFDVVTVIRADYEEDSYAEHIAKDLGRIRGELTIGYIHNDGTFEEIGL